VTQGWLGHLQCRLHRPLGWTGAALDGAIHQVGQFTSLTARDGVIRISYYDGSHGDLKVLRPSPLSNPL
jgi:hypothetical protein